MKTQFPVLYSVERVITVTGLYTLYPKRLTFFTYPRLGSTNEREEKQYHIIS